MRGSDFRISSYRQMLKAALDGGYEFAGFDEIGREKGPRTCLLRHDVDLELFNCGPMLDVERQLGVRATYFVMTRSTMYNLFCLESLAIIKRILADGHWLGLHFMGERMEGRDGAAISAEVQREARWLEQEFGTSINAVSFHQPTQAILDGQLVIPGLINAYNHAQLGPYVYVSDTNMTWRREHPLEIFNQALHPRLQLLIHPIWWTENEMGTLEKWRSALRHNQGVVSEHLQSRERTLKNERLWGDDGETP